MTVAKGRNLQLGRIPVQPAVINNDKVIPGSMVFMESDFHDAKLTKFNEPGFQGLNLIIMS